MNWRHKIKIKHLLTRKEDAESVRASMLEIANVLGADPYFQLFTTLHRFRSIPDGDEIVTPLDYANKLMDSLYDFADQNSIWID